MNLTDEVVILKDIDDVITTRIVVVDEVDNVNINIHVTKAG